jgi:predicted transcriptional regulator of viral defense system
MTAYNLIWDIAVDNYGIITSQQAADIGISRQCLRALVDSGKLVRHGHGVYQVYHHVPCRFDVYATAVAVVGKGGFLRGASVIAMHELCPTNPGLMYVGSSIRVRRNFPRGFILKDRYDIPTTYYNGIKCQFVAFALEEAKAEGTIESDMIRVAAELAYNKGLITHEEAAKFKD